MIPGSQKFGLPGRKLSHIPTPAARPSVNPLAVSTRMSASFRASSVGPARCACLYYVN